MFKYAALALVAVAGATPAFAQDGSAFTGFNINAIVGWDHPEYGGFSDDGVAFGVGVGYDASLGGAVVGVELEAADSSSSKFGLSAKRDLYGGIRVGAEVGPGTLLYAKAGYTNARVGCGAGCGFNLDGIRAGAGVEHQFGTNVYIKAEYRYSNYETGVERHQVMTGVGFRF